MEKPLPRRCWYRTFNPRSRKYSEWLGGTLHAWGTENDSCEYSSPYCVGVIEDDISGDILTINVTDIRFVNP